MHKLLTRFNLCIFSFICFFSLTACSPKAPESSSANAAAVSENDQKKFTLMFDWTANNEADNQEKIAALLISKEFTIEKITLPISQKNDFQHRIKAQSKKLMSQNELTHLGQQINKISPSGILSSSFSYNDKK